MVGATHAAAYGFAQNHMNAAEEKLNRLLREADVAGESVARVRERASNAAAPQNAAALCTVSPSAVCDETLEIHRFLGASPRASMLQPQSPLPPPPPAHVASSSQVAPGGHSACSQPTARSQPTASSQPTACSQPTASSQPASSSKLASAVAVYYAARHGAAERNENERMSEWRDARFQRELAEAKAAVLELEADNAGLRAALERLRDDAAETGALRAALHESRQRVAALETCVDEYRHREGDMRLSLREAEAERERLRTLLAGTVWFSEKQ
jgi:hypothetical protein